MPERRYPWLVVDTWGEKPPVGCWTEAAAKALPGQITAGYEMGRWRAEAAQSDDPEPTKTDTLGPDSSTA